MNNKKPTIQDIAYHAGVGPGTVSRVLNNHPNVSEKTRTKVLAVMEAMDYRPSFAARHMRTQKSQLIGFITDEVATTPYAGEIIQGAQDVAWEKERFLMVVTTGNDFGRTQAAVEALLERDVEGIIYAAMFHREARLPDEIREVPTVLANCYIADRSLPSVVPDEFNGGYSATLALLAKGHKRIGFLNVNPIEPGVPASIGRLNGYKQALAEYNLHYDPAIIRFGNGDADSGYRYTYEVMSLPQPPTALFCGNDRMAMGAYNALRELNLRMPNDVAVVGFDNQELITTALRPSLTSVQLPHYAMGYWAMDYLFKLDDDPTPVQHLIECPLVERDST